MLRQPIHLQFPEHGIFAWKKKIFKFPFYQSIDTYLKQPNIDIKFLYLNSILNISLNK